MNPTSTPPPPLLVRPAAAPGSGGTPAAESPAKLPQIAADFEVHKAGLAAAAAAKSQGCDPATAGTLLDGAVGFTVEGLHFPPLGAAITLALDRLNAVIASSPLLQDKTCELAAIAFALHDTKTFWRAIRSGDVRAFEDAVFDFTTKLSLEGLHQVTAWINQEYARLRTDAEEAGVGKQQPPAEAETPPAASPPSAPGTAMMPESAGC